MFKRKAQVVEIHTAPASTPAAEQKPAKKARTIINFPAINEKISQLRDFVNDKKDSFIDSVDPMPVLRGLVKQIADEFSDAWREIELTTMEPLRGAIEGVRNDIFSFKPDQLAETCEAAIEAATQTMRKLLRQETSDMVAFRNQRKTLLGKTRKLLAAEKIAMYLKKIRVCGDADAHITADDDENSAMNAALKVLLVGAAIGVEVMIGIKAQQHKTNLMLAVGITTAAIMLMFTASHYGMSALKRKISYGGFKDVFESKYRLNNDGRRQDIFGVIVEFPLANKADTFTSRSCLALLAIVCAVVVGYRFIAGQGSSLADTTNLGAILMVLLTALFAIETFHFASPFNEAEYDGWKTSVRAFAQLAAEVKNLSKPSESQELKFRNMIESIEQTYTNTVSRLLKEVADLKESLNDNRKHCMGLWNEYLDFGKKFLETHFREAVTGFIAAVCDKNSIPTANVDLRFMEAREMLVSKMSLLYDNPTLHAEFTTFSFDVPLADNLKIVDFSAVEAQILREEEARFASANAGHFELED